MSFTPTEEGTVVSYAVLSSVATQHTPADDVVYDLVSVQYHALKSAEVIDKYLDKYLQDAEDHDDVLEFFEQIARGGRRARRAVPRTARRLDPARAELLTGRRP